jgi:hypothetical protein
MLPFYSFTFVLLLACAIFYYRAGEFEGRSGVVWAGLSITLSLLVWRIFHWGWPGILLSQVGLFAGITVGRTLRKS